MMALVACCLLESGVQARVGQQAADGPLTCSEPHGDEQWTKVKHHSEEWESCILANESNSGYRFARAWLGHRPCAGVLWFVKLSIDVAPIGPSSLIIRRMMRGDAGSTPSR